MTAGVLDRPTRALVTGCAGFIGSHLAERLVEAGHEVLGVDSFTDYYERRAKERNLMRLRDEPSFELVELDLSRDVLAGLLEGVEVVFHLAGQPGVRGSFGESFASYVRHNVLATQRLLEEAARRPPATFTYASSSSVYGNAASQPTTEASQRRPVSPYGLTKLAAEELAGVYHRCFGVPVTGLRYFTVYGPRQRPDMAFSLFLRRVLAGEPVPINGDGRQVRDFTFVSDAAEGTLAAAARGRPGAVYNVGGGRPVELLEAVGLIGELTGRPVGFEPRPALVGDARATCCGADLAQRELRFEARVELRDGLAAQLEWLLSEQPVRSKAVAA